MQAINHHEKNIHTEGENLLHAAVRNIITQQSHAHELEEFLRQYPQPIVASMSVETNNQGKIPFSLIHESTLHHDIKLALHDLLSPYMLPQHIKKLYEEITEETTLSLDDTLLEQHLKYARRVVNEVRAIIKQSSTHPDYNTLMEHQKDNLSYTRTQQCKKVWDQKPKNMSELVDKGAQAACTSGIGNCEEFSWVAQKILQRLNPAICGELYHVEKGNHCFLVLGREPSSDLHDWTTWGEHAVICDPWLGEVFPAHAIPTHLRTLFACRSVSHTFIPKRCPGDTFYSRKFNYLTSFNPNFHRLIPGRIAHEDAFQIQSSLEATEESKKPSSP